MSVPWGELGNSGEVCDVILISGKNKNYSFLKTDSLADTCFWANNFQKMQNVMGNKFWKVFDTQKNIFFQDTFSEKKFEKFSALVLNFVEKNRDSKILGRNVCSSLEKTSLQLLLLVQNKKHFFFKDFKVILKNVARAIFDKAFCCSKFKLQNKKIPFFTLFFWRNFCKISSQLPFLAKNKKHFFSKTFKVS